MPNALGTLVGDSTAADPDFGNRAVRITEYSRPSGNDEAITAQSIAWMQRLACQDKTSRPIRDAAIAVIADLGYGSSSKTKEIADAVFRWVKSTVTYQHEDDMRTPLDGFARFVVDQTLIAPAALLRMPQPAGDCVDYSMLTAALCSLFGLRTAFKTIAADPASSDYSHVYVVAELQPAQFYPLDTSNGPEAGVEFDLPKGKKSRLWWTGDRSGNMVTRRRAFYRGRLGDDSTDTSSLDTSGDFTTLPLDITDTTAGILAPSAGIPSAPAGSSSPSTTGLISTILNDATATLSPIIRQSTIKAPYYITGANGAQILYDPSTGAVANAPGYAAPLNLGGINPLWLVGIVVGASALLALAHK